MGQAWVPQLVSEVPGTEAKGAALLRCDYRFAEEIADRLLRGAPPESGPDRRQAVTRAVFDIACGAAEGDTDLRAALEWLRAGKPLQAEPALRAFAEARSREAAPDRKQAAIAYRDLGAILSLADLALAQAAYAEAVRLDERDLHSETWAGWLAKEIGALTEGEMRLGGLPGQDAEDHWTQFWAWIGMGDIAALRGELALAAHRHGKALALAERPGRAPDHVVRLRDRFLARDRVETVRMMRGEFRAVELELPGKQEIAERLALLDPQFMIWRRGIAASYCRFGKYAAERGDHQGAMRWFMQARFEIGCAGHAAPGEVPQDEQDWLSAQLLAVDGRLGDASHSLQVGTREIGMPDV